MTTNKRKTTTAIVAGVTAVALLLGGTFAWTSISQQAKNESAGIVNVGGRLHDDFNGENKDVYVENFTDSANGGQPIYARVRLDEYMEVGSEAGQANNADRKATPVVANTDINDVETWSPHVPAESCNVCDTGETCKIHTYWEWDMGNEEAKVFMPTFNKDKDSLEADINGTYAGTNPDDKVYYDDYVTYVTENGAVVSVIENTVDATAVTIPEGATGANALTEANKEVSQVTANAYYDNDPNTDKNTVADVEYITKEETHTAKQTATAEVITMEQWLSEDTANGGKNGQPGNYWVYDTDGWAYWANPIMPGEATGLLLNGTKMTSNPGEKCYYAINVVGQFATVGDWEYFDENQDSEFDGTDEAKTLLETVSKNVATVTVTNISGTTNVDRGATVNFEANISVNGQQVLVASDFDWFVLNADLTASTTSTITDGVLTVGDKEKATSLIIVAKAKDEKYLGALGMSSIAVNPPPIPDEITAIADVEVGSTTTVTIDNMDWYVLAKEDGKALIWAADVIPDVKMGFIVGGSVSNNIWKTSDVREYLNGEYYDSLSVLKSHAVPSTIYTADYHDRSGDYIETQDTVFLPSEADLFGTANGAATNVVKEYSSGVADCVVSDVMWLDTDHGYWLRSPLSYDDSVAAVYEDTGAKYSNCFYQWNLRPAMWVKYAPDIEVSVTVPNVEFNEYGSATVKDGTQVTFQATATADGEPMENPEFVYELYNTTYEDTFLEEGAITSEGVWDTTGDGPTSHGYSYYVKVYVKDYPDEYVKLSFLVQP